eukprot:Blabericola_migrator_1__6065@NODE_305_length_10106_cov_125_059269_g249_i0_p3_GENE_NODE_305_length_10106_cov_125_059269_g249_i0NODE_305_length_10106_cov_125_059269_g249_i0_p3_ORF_typecomplete_len242_score33_47Aerolysin/PF01117_20/2_1zfRanBP/PF00641_18/0_69zfRanBP/PF00641_18/1_2e03_NODE_305_length_10106_cov_125_059269_g249_i022682993
MGVDWLCKDVCGCVNFSHTLCQHFLPVRNTYFPVIQCVEDMCGVCMYVSLRLTLGRCHADMLCRRTLLFVFIQVLLWNVSAVSIRPSGLFLGIPGLSSLKTGYLKGRAELSSGDTKNELKLKADLTTPISKGDTNGSGAARVVQILSTPEKYHMDQTKANAIAQTMMTAAGYDLSRAKQTASTYQAAHAMVTTATTPKPVIATIAVVATQATVATAQTSMTTTTSSTTILSSTHIAVTQGK